jgi:enterochelin esterase-like enzyme
MSVTRVLGRLKRLRTGSRPAVGRGRRARTIAVGCAVAWLALGLAGAYAYVDRYAVYRGFAAPTLPAGVPSAHVERVAFWSRALHRRSSYLAVQPPGYAREAAAGRRFGVMYLLHGSPGGTQQFLTVGEMQVRLAELVHARRMPPTLLVIPAGLEGIANDTEWANTRKGRYEDYALEVVHRVDARFPTLADRDHRVIAGMSEGGYAAVDLALRHLAVFGGVESWSGYYTETATGPFAGASPALLRAYSPSAYVGSRAGELHRLGLRAYLYQGTGNPDPEGLVRFANRLHAAGADVAYAFFPGNHDWRLWRRHVPAMMVLAGRWLRQPPPRRPTALTHVGRPPTAAHVRRALRAERRWRRGGGAARLHRRS